MKTAVLSSLALALYLLVSSMSYQDEIIQEQLNCEDWPVVFDYCEDRE